MDRNHSYYLGVFDLTKGYLMLAIFMVHTLNFVYVPLMTLVGSHPVREFFLQLFYQVPLLLNAAMMVLFMVSGFGFRKGDVLLTLKEQAKLLLVPYLICGAVSSLLYYICYRLVSPPDAPIGIQTICHIRGYLLGVTDTNVIPGGWAVYVGAVWFLPALFIAWNILNLLMLVVPERGIPAACIILAVCGYLLSVTLHPLFCISQALIGILPLYTGTRIREDRLLLRKMPPAVFALLLSGTLLSILFGDLRLAEYRFKLGLIEIPLAMCTAFLVLYGAVAVDHVDGRWTEPVRTMGRHSLLILCLHTIEMKAVPWYWVLDKTRLGLFGDVIVTFIIRCLLVFAMFRLVLLLQGRWHRYQRRKKKRGIRKGGVQ